MSDEIERRDSQEGGAAHLEDRIPEDEESLRKQRELWITSQGGKLCLELYAKFQEYRRFLQSTSFAARDPFFEWCRQPEHLMMLEALKYARDYDLERAERNLKNLEKARQAARCEHHYMDGEQCAAPRLKDGKLCRMHQGIEDAKAVKLDLGPLEDPDSIQAGIRKIVAAVVDGKLDKTQASQLGYLIQLAAWNVMRTSTAVRAREVE